MNVVSAGGAHTIVLVVAHEAAGQRDLSMPAVRESITRHAARRARSSCCAPRISRAARSDADVVNYLARRLVEAQGKVPGGVMPAAPGAR